MLATSSAGLVAGGAALHLGAESAEADEMLDGFSDAWLGKITGKHKQFFDATSVNNGFGLVFAMNFLNSNNDALKLPDSQVSAVVGLRHFAAPIGFTDEIWSKYKVAEALGIMDPQTKKPATRNFLFHPKDGDLMFPASAMEKLLARGVQFTVCNVALTALSGMTAKNAGVTPEAAKKEWLAGMIPGMNLVPSGVMAVNRAQEKGCTYCNGG
ncbi:MAG: hypothetical protein ABJE47_18085 [bacterium]